MRTAPAYHSFEAEFHGRHAPLGRAAAVFAELCAGDAKAGDHAVATAIAAQLAEPGANGEIVAIRLWRALLALPDFSPGPAHALPSPLEGMGRLPFGLRVLVLASALSGLSDAELAALLGRPPASCRQALARARAWAGEADWLVWSSALAARVQAVPSARLSAIIRHVGNLSAAALSDQTLDEAHRAPAKAYRRAQIGVVLATAGALALTHVWPETIAGDGEPLIRTRALKEHAPIARFDAAAAIVTHPDRALLDIPASDAGIARETDFYAWYQAERMGTASYEPPSPTHEAPESASSNIENGGGHDGP